MNNELSPSQIEILKLIEEQKEIDLPPPRRNFDKTIIKVWTISLSQWRVAKEKNIPLLDITAKSGNPCFAPNFETVIAYKSGKVSEEDYTRLYYEKMRLSLKEYPDQWKALLNASEVALACYCPADVFCHRYLFQDMLEKYANRHGVIIERCGEIKK